MAKPIPTNSFHPKTRNELREWLTQNWNTPSGVWVISFKKATGLPMLDYGAIVEECLCFGWIDSKPGTIDDERWMLYIAPRKQGSNWSALNKQRAQAMIAAGLMQAPGMQKIEASQADGSWTALKDVDALRIPADLLDCFQQYTHAEANFTALPKSVQRGILEWILNAKRPETRAKRVEETARLAAEGQRANQWRK